MSGLKLTRPEQMLFALLRAALYGSEANSPHFASATPEEWKSCFRMAARQGVIALAWDGVISLPREKQPPKEVKIAWGTGVSVYEDRYKYYCQAIDELSRFYAKYGIATMQLKGVGFSSLYPVPAHREGGDIDIYTYSADTSLMSHREATELADRLMREQGIIVITDYDMHSQFRYKGITIENHKTFLNVQKSAHIAAANRILQHYMSPQLTPLAVGRVLTPSLVFNALFIPFHAAQHYGNGLSLRHLCDWAVLIGQDGFQMPAEMTDKYFLRFIDALSMLCHEFLGSPLQTKGDTRFAYKVLEEMLHPKYVDDISGKGKIAVFCYKVGRMFYRYRLSHSVFHTSIFREVWTSIVYHVRKPEAIFKL